MTRNSLNAHLAGVVAALAVGAAVWPASAAPLDPSLQAQLLGLYDSYNRAIVAGNLDQAMAVRDHDTREAMSKAMPSGRKRGELLGFLRLTVPDSTEVLHSSLSKDGGAATILVLAHRKPTAGASPGTPAESEVTLSFVKQAGAWTFGDQVFGMDPRQIKACKNQAFEPIDAYDQNTSRSVAGPIVRVAFEADHTLVIIRVVDEENCVFLPSRDELVKAGFNPELLVPYAIIEVDGFPHKSDQQKTWADHIKMSEE